MKRHGSRLGLGPVTEPRPWAADRTTAAPRRPPELWRAFCSCWRWSADTTCREPSPEDVNIHQLACTCVQTPYQYIRMGNSVVNYIVTLNVYIYTSTCCLLRPDLLRTCARASPLATTQLELYLEEEVFLVRRTVLEGDLEDGRHPASLLRQLHQRRHRVLACSEDHVIVTFNTQQS